MNLVNGAAVNKSQFGVIPVSQAAAERRSENFCKSVPETKCTADFDSRRSS